MQDEKPLADLQLPPQLYKPSLQTLLSSAHFFLVEFIRRERHFTVFLQVCPRPGYPSAIVHLSLFI